MEASHAWLSREPGSCEYKAFAALDGVAIERDVFPEALSAVAEETENALCTKLARGENQGPEKNNFLTIEDYENQAIPQSAFDAFGLGGREADGASSFASSSEEEKESAGRARVLQRRGRVRARELVKMAESMPVEAKRLSAMETKSETRKTLEVHAASLPEFCDWSSLMADTNVGRWRCGAVTARRHAFESAGFCVDLCSGEVLLDCFGRPISLDQDLAEIIGSEPWGDRPKLSRGAISLALEPFMEKGNG